MYIHDLLDKLKPDYDVTFRDSTRVDISREIKTKEELQTYYFTSRVLLDSASTEWKKGAGTLRVVLNGYIVEERFGIDSITGWNGDRRFLKTMGTIGWCARQQLKKEWGLPLEIPDEEDFHRMVEEITAFPFPKTCHERTLMDPFLPHDLLLMHDRLTSSVPVVRYQHPGEKNGQWLHYAKEGVFRIDGELYDTLEEAWEVFEKKLKKDRLALLYL